MHTAQVLSLPLLPSNQHEHCVRVRGGITFGYFPSLCKTMLVLPVWWGVPKVECLPARHTECHALSVSKEMGWAARGFDLRFHS